MNCNVVILAAGLGTGMKSKHATALHRAGGLTLVEHVLNAALAVTTPDRIVVVIGHRAERVNAALKATGVRFAFQPEQKGTGDALLVCREAVPHDGLLLVLHGDVPLLSAATLRSLVDIQTKSGNAATLITARLGDSAPYGPVLLDEAGSVAAIVARNAATSEQLAVNPSDLGIYCFRSDTFWEHIGEIRPDNPAREHNVADMAEILSRFGHRVGSMEISDPSELLGIKTRMELAAADRVLRERKVRELMDEGVTIEKPETVTIDFCVQIGCDTVVEPFARLLGRTVVGEDCVIGACSIVVDSRLGDAVEIGPFTQILGSQIDTGAHAGPFARIRMGAHLEQNVRVGNFVEIKNSWLGKGVKALHLAYLGDASLGEDANIGAGTITCNSDGKLKFRTTIGPGAFIGSNSTLVAPIDIGENSYIGAGSVITDTVPPDALALGRVRQVIKQAWAAKRKPLSS
jgi:bifunctional UDP-N-acetylglucosamine pyrophosphorylase/glucosamine-1-phosphate N-acetyltransferase